MPRKNQNQRNRQTLAARIVASFGKDEKEFTRLVNEALDNCSLRDELVNAIIREFKNDAEKAKECLISIYAIASMMFRTIKTAPGRERRLISDVFSFTVSGPSGIIKHVFEGHKGDVSTMFRRCGWFKEDASVLILADAYALNDATQITPQVVHDLSLAAMVADYEQMAEVAPKPWTDMPESGDVCRTFVGVYLRLDDGKPDNFPYPPAERADVITSYEEVALNLFGPDCHVGYPFPVIHMFSEIIIDSLDMLTEKVDDSFFLADPERSVSNDGTTLTFEDPDRIRIFYRIPKIVAIMADHEIRIWLHENTGYYDEEFANENADSQPDDEDDHEVREQFRDNVINFPSRS